jgi:hypothetical protein
MMGQEGVAGAGRGSQYICTTNRNCNACELFYFDFHVSDAYVFGQSPAAPKIGDKYAAFRAYVVDGLPQ